VLCIPVKKIGAASLGQKPLARRGANGTIDAAPL